MKSNTPAYNVSYVNFVKGKGSVRPSTTTDTVTTVAPVHGATYIGDFPDTLDWTKPYDITPLPYTPAPADPSAPLDIDPIARMAEVMAGVIGSSGGVRKRVAEVETDGYHVELELSGVEPSDVTVTKHGSTLSIEIVSGDSTFDEESVLENSRTKLYDIEVEIPSHVDPTPRRLRMKNGLLSLSFNFADSIELQVEDENPDFLKEAVEEMGEEEQ